MLDKQGLTAEVSVGVTYSSLMSAVSLFFTGVLISQYNSFNPTIKVPLIFLIISTFSFIFSATIYTNAGAEITLNKLRVVEKYMVYGKNLMELLGLYPFILATPLVIGAVTRDSFLRTTTILVAITGFTLYSQSKFSVLERELARPNKRVLSAAIVALTLLLYYSQSAPGENALAIYSAIAVILMLVIVLSAYYFSIRSKQYKPTYFRAFQDTDAEILANIIHKNLSKVKASKYSADVMDKVRAQYSPKSLLDLASEKQVFVAEFNDKVVGLVALAENVISDVFTDPGLHRKGIGRMLVEYAEKEAFSHGHRHTGLVAGKVDHAFYKRLGYRDVKDSQNTSEEGFLMTKELRN